MQILELCRSEQVSFGEIAVLVSRDPALSAKVLQVVNSPFYGMRRDITTLSHACGLLGIRAICALALSFSLVSDLQERQKGSFDYTNFWRRSLISAVAARALGSSTNVPNQEELFLVALLQDIGMLALDKIIPDLYSRMLIQADNDHGQVQELEQQHLGCDHSDLSVYLAGRWNLPDAFVTAFRHSHETKPEVLLELEMGTRCAVLSGDLTDIWLGEKNLDAFCEASMKAQTVLDMPPETLEGVLAKVGDALPDLSTVFEVDLRHSHETKPEVLLELEMGTRCAVLSGDLTDIWLGEKNLDAFCEASMKAQTVLDMPPETLEGVLAKVGDALPDLSTVFEVDLGSPEETNAVLEQAKEALLALSLETMQEAQRTKVTTDILESENRTLKQQVDRDPLTELYNRYFLEEALANEFEKAGHSKQPLSLVFLDIDNFKNVNDQHGHPLGDRVIVAVARIIEQNLRNTDVAARYGGEEFVLVLPRTDTMGASKISQRIIQLLADELFSGANGESFSVTMSGRIRNLLRRLRLRESLSPD